LQQNGFLWVHTPILTSSDCEGAGELFKVTTLDLENLPKDLDGQINYKEDFFGCEAFLTVSGQLNAESYCLALSKVYTFGPTFRAESSNTTRHLAEFWMVEPEVAFANLMDNAKLAQDLLKYICKIVLEKNSEEMEFFAKFQNPEVIHRLEQILTQEFAHITYSEAIDYLLKSNRKFENDVYWGIDLASEHERFLCEELLKRPTIVTNYPKEIKAFYMRQNEDGKTVAAMDVLAPGIGEIIGGSQREERYELLLNNIKQKGLQEKTLHWYLELRRFGTAPHSGFGLGLDRLISYITGVPNIRDIIPFPRAHKSISF
jgi:asparaginyl-tRNA synthetase